MHKIWCTLCARVKAILFQFYIFSHAYARLHCVYNKSLTIYRYFTSIVSFVITLQKIPDVMKVSLLYNILYYNGGEKGKYVIKLRLRNKVTVMKLGAAFSKLDNEWNSKESTDRPLRFPLSWESRGKGGADCRAPGYNVVSLWRHRARWGGYVTSERESMKVGQGCRLRYMRPMQPTVASSFSYYSFYLMPAFLLWVERWKSLYVSLFLFNLFFLYTRVNKSVLSLNLRFKKDFYTRTIFDALLKFQITIYCEIYVSDKYSI